VFRKNSNDSTARLAGRDRFVVGYLSAAMHFSSINRGVHFPITSTPPARCRDRNKTWNNEWQTSEIFHLSSACSAADLYFRRVDDEQQFYLLMPGDTLA
jgi:hypothetical protein